MADWQWNGELALVDLFFFARLTVVAFAAGSIFLTYLIGKRLRSYHCGLLAAALLAAAPLHADYSRLARTDIPMTFFVLASTWFVISIAQTGRWRDYLVAGFLLGLGVATKYPALLLAVVIIWVHILRQIETGLPAWANLPRLIGSGIATLFGVFAGSPYLFIDYKSAWTDITFEARGYHVSATSDGFFSALTWYLGTPLLTSIGLLGALMALVGAVSVIRQRSLANIYIAGFSRLLSDLYLIAFIAVGPLDCPGRSVSLPARRVRARGSHRLLSQDSGGQCADSPARNRLGFDARDAHTTLALCAAYCKRPRQHRYANDGARMDHGKRSARQRAACGIEYAAAAKRHLSVFLGSVPNHAE